MSRGMFERWKRGGIVASQDTFMDTLSQFMANNAAIAVAELENENEMNKLALELTMRNLDSEIGDLESSFELLSKEYTSKGGQLSKLPDVNTTGNASTLLNQNFKDTSELIASNIEIKGKKRQELLAHNRILKERLEVLDEIDSIFADTAPGDDNVYDKGDFFDNLAENLTKSIKGITPSSYNLEKKTNQQGEAIGLETGVDWMDDYLGSSITATSIQKRNLDYIKDQSTELQYNINLRQYEKLDDGGVDDVKTRIVNLNSGINAIVNPLAVTGTKSMSYSNYNLAYGARIKYEVDASASGVQLRDNTGAITDQTYKDLINRESAALQQLGTPLSIASGGTISAAAAGEQYIKNIKTATDSKAPSFEKLVSNYQLLDSYYKNIKTDQDKQMFRNTVGQVYGIDLEGEGFDEIMLTISQGLKEKKELNSQLINLSISNNITVQNATIPPWFSTTVTNKKGKIASALVNVGKKYDLLKSIDATNIDMDTFTADLTDYILNNNISEKDFAGALKTFIEAWEFYIEQGNFKYIQNLK